MKKEKRFSFCCIVSELLKIWCRLAEFSKKGSISFLEQTFFVQFSSLTERETWKARRGKKKSLIIIFYATRFHLRSFRDVWSVGDADFPRNMNLHFADR